MVTHKLWHPKKHWSMCFTLPFHRERQDSSGVDSLPTTRNRQSTRRSWQLGHLHFTLHLHLKWFWGQAVMLASPADHLNLFMRDLRIMNVFTGLVATQSIYHNCNRLLYMIQWWHPNLHLKWFSDSIFIGKWGAPSKMDFANPLKTGIVSLMSHMRTPNLLERSIGYGESAVAFDDGWNVHARST